MTIATLLGLDAQDECPHAFSLWWECKLCRRALDEKIAVLESANTPLEEWRKRVQSAIRDGLRALREVQESGDVDPEEAGGAINRVEHLLLGCLPAGEQWPIPPAVTGTTSDNAPFRQPDALTAEEARAASDRLGKVSKMHGVVAGGPLDRAMQKLTAIADASDTPQGFRKPISHDPPGSCAFTSSGRCVNHGGDR